MARNIMDWQPGWPAGDAVWPSSDQERLPEKQHIWVRQEQPPSGFPG